VARVEAENSANSISSASIEALQSAMMSSTSIMNGITSLQSDPQVQALLADPEVLRAIQSLDFDTLSTNPKIQALMKNPKVKALQAEIGMGQ
jgi:ubiquinone biosynthesis protein Coq4